MTGCVIFMGVMQSVDSAVYAIFKEDIVSEPMPKRMIPAARTNKQILCAKKCIYITHSIDLIFLEVFIIWKVQNAYGAIYIFKFIKVH